MGRSFFLAFCCLLLAFSASGQQNRYEYLKKKGLGNYKHENYEEAIENYLAALHCDEDEIDQNELAGLIKEAQRAREEQLITARDSARRAQHRAEENARMAREAEKEANRQAQIAREERGRAERRTREVLSNILVSIMDTVKDRTTQFRLAEYAARIDPENPRVTRKLIDNYYHREDYYHTTLYGHQDGVRRAQFSPDGTRVVSASWDKTAKVWDVATGRELFTLTGHEDYVRAAVYSPDGAKIVTSSGNDWAFKDMSIRVWDANTGAQLYILKGHTKAIRSVAFANHSNRIVTASHDNTVRIWDLDKRMEVDPPLEHPSSVITAAFSPDEKKVITAAEDGVVRVWHLATKKRRVTEVTFGVPAISVTYSHDGDKVLFTLWDGRVAIYDFKTSKYTYYTGHENAVISGVFSANDSLILTASYDGTARLWDVGTQEELFVLRGHTNSLFSAAFSPDEHKIVTASIDKTVKIWHLDNPPAVMVLPTDSFAIHSSVFSSGRGQVLAALENGSFMVWDVKKQLEDFARGQTKTDIGPEDLEARYSYEINTLHTKMRVFSIFDRQREMAATSGGNAWKHFAAFSNDGKKAVSSQKDKSLKLLDANSLEAISTLPTTHNKFLSSACFSPDGEKLVTTSPDSTARIWDVQGHRELLPALQHESAVLSAAFSPDGILIATATFGGRIRIWDAATHEALFDLTGHKGAVNSVVFSHDGNRLLSSSFDKTAKVWSLAARGELISLTGHTAEVFSALYAPDSSKIATVSWDRTIKVWDAFSGVFLYEMKGHDDYPWGISFHPAEGLLLSFTSGKVYLWWIDAESIIQEATSRHAISHLTPEQIGNYNLEDSFDYAGITIEHLIKEGNEEQLFNFAEYFMMKARQTGNRIQKEEYRQKAKQLCQFLVGNAWLHPTEFYEERLSSIGN
ncbi:MAG: WD40 repeat domain-containing protein [Lewinellaceae bacterium]|nr:WD40 repeat domain-containing protein [Phaeodactylibacter sp.]MCB9352126.1 WD40 repeat domain-containing protein [Lewinellaceae bacterium]